MLENKKKNRIFDQDSIQTNIIILRILSLITTFSILVFFLIKSNNKIATSSFFILTITATLIILPIIFISEKQKSMRKSITISTLLFIFISLILYAFPFQIFSIFIFENGLLNYTVYAFKIIFFAFPLLGYKTFIEKKITNKINKLNILSILYLFKDFIILLITTSILFNIYSLSGTLWSIPISVVLSTLINIIILIV